MPTVQELREARAKAGHKITELANKMQTEKRDLTTEERTAWDSANADFDRCTRELEVQARADQVKKVLADPAGSPAVGREDFDPKAARRGLTGEQAEEYRALAVQAWFRSQVKKPLTEGHRRACKVLRFNPHGECLPIVSPWKDARRNALQAEWRNSGMAGREAILHRESRASLSAQIGTSGQYLIAPGTMAAQFELNLLAFGGALQVADVFTTESGEPYIEPTIDDTGNTGALLSENTSIGAGVNPVMGQKIFMAYKFSSTPVLVPSEFIDDNVYDLPGKLGEMLGTRLGRGQAPYLATGTGASQPSGIVTGATSAFTSGSATAITFDELVRLEHSIDPAYRGMGCGWLMHDSIKSYIRRIKDGSGRPMWISGENYQSAADNGAPERLLTYPVNICQELDAANTTTAVPVTAKKHVLFGLLSKFKVRRVRDVRLYRLVERYRDLDQDAFIAFQRLDSKVIDAGTHPIKYITQA